MLNNSILKYPEKLFNHTSTLVMIINSTRAIIWINEACERCLGYHPADVKGTGSRPSLSADHEKRFAFLIDQTLEGSLPDAVDMSMTCLDGTRKSVRWNAMLVRDDQTRGQTLVVVSGVVNTYENKRQTGLAAAEERYRLLFENVGVGLLFIREDTIIAMVNKEFEKQTGYSRAEVEGKISWTAFIADAEEVRRMTELHRLRRIDRALPSEAYETRVKHRRGNIIEVSVRVILIPGTSYSLVSFLDITQQKQTEEMIRESEAKYRSLVDNMQDTLYRCDGRGNITFCNPSGARLLGYDQPEDVLGMNIGEDFYYHPHDRVRFLEELAVRGRVTNYEITLKHKNGSPITISTNSHLFYDREGNILGVEGLFSDITRRKETEKILKDSEERLHAITRSVPGVVYQFYAADSGEYGINYTTDRMTEMFGLSEEEATSFPAFLAHVHEDDQDRFVASIRKSVERCISWNFEGRFVKPSGELIWFDGLSVPARYEDRMVFNGILLDITDRKKVEELSRQSEDKFTKVFMMSPDCIAITRMADGLIIEVNIGFEEIVGWKREDVVGLTSQEINFWEHPEDRFFMVQELSAGDCVVEREILFRCKDGSLRTGIYFARTIQIDGDPHLIFVLHDITAQRRLEEERQKLEEQLFQSQKMDAIGQLASGVAHDFNNILTGIQGNTALLMLEYDSDHPYYQRLSLIEDNVKRGANLTRQLLGFARGGKYEVKTLDINQLIRKNAQLFLETRKEIEADFLLQDKVYPVDADAGQLEQVLLNIYINAGHAMPKGGNLQIQTANVELLEKDAAAFKIRPGNYIRISISDTGTGMDQSTVNRIFEPFFTTKSKQGGTGLGLASAYGIIRNHGGAISVHSATGHGATFTIYLPSSHTEVVPEKQEAEKGLVRGSGGILLVDDEPLILGAVSELLKILGYAVYRAGSGQEAVSIYMEKRNVIDLVILDMILPGISGAEVLSMIKDVNPDVKVILSSGYSMQGEVQKVMDLGCVGFIQKPYSLADLSSAVHQAMGTLRADTE